MTEAPHSGGNMIGRIPVRNLWLLMLYASEITRFLDRMNILLERDSEDLPDMVAELLASAVDYRLNRNLTHGYRGRRAVLTRVRGRIDLLKTEANLLLAKGEVACRFHELSMDTPRNRFVRAALERMAALVRSRDLSQRSRFLASTLMHLGVRGERPTRTDLALEQFGRNDSEDRFMMALAQLAFDLALPTEFAGSTPMVSPEREDQWVRRLFEKAVLGFAKVEFEPLGWKVSGGGQLNWQVSSATDGFAAKLPKMVTDILLTPPFGGRQLIVDTKFTSIYAANRYGNDRFKSQYIYQIYAYVRSREGASGYVADGMLLHPAVEESVFEHAVIQGHTLGFATVNLSASSSEIREELRRVLSSNHSRFITPSARPDTADSTPPHRGGGHSSQSQTLV